MRGVLSLLLVLLTVAAAPAAAAPAPRASLPDVEDEVMCVECGTALNISEAPSADRERAFIRRRIAEGKTKPQIKAALVAEYGRNVLGTPDDHGFGVAAWLVPVLLAVLAVAAVFTTARRWRRTPASVDAASHDPAGADGRDALDPEDARRLERDMAGYDL
jgi:cytochrome c-type biogenesis protein CcmH